MSDTNQRVEQMQHKLDDLGEEIDEAKADAEEVLPEERREQTFVDPGTIGTDKIDDTIVPPG